jgi:hypothetical protein
MTATETASLAAAGDETDTHRRYTGIPAADDTGVRMSAEYSVTPTTSTKNAPKIAGPKDADSLSSYADGSFDETSTTPHGFEESEGGGGLMRITSEKELVANGFVRDGSSLPYVFETSEAGEFMSYSYETHVT